MPRARRRERERRRSPASGRHADSIRLALLETAPAGLKMARLMAVAELSRSQVVRGLAAYRELAGEKRWPPLLWSFECGYHFCQDHDALQSYEIEWAEVKYTQVSSLMSNVLEEHCRLFPKSRWVQYFMAQVNAIHLALDMIAHPQAE
ncbi:RacP protein [Streptomyces chrestomyceticus]|uniref:RacP protein n=1 Tax=Streptomyces chrestomyceticus TaxID=68185 RepID=UPI0033E72FB7